EASEADGGEVVLRLAYRPPYDWAQVRDFLATRAVPGVERVDARGYARTIAVAANQSVGGRSANPPGGHAIVCVRPLEGENALELGAPAEEVAARLEALPGFGAWTAQYVALRALGEPDAFPAADLVLRRMAAPAGAPLTRRALEARAEAWRPWRGYAVLHLWRAGAMSRRPGQPRDVARYDRER